MAVFFSVAAFEISTMLGEGRRADADKKIDELLRAGYSDEHFLRLVADLQKPKTKPGKRTGRPKLKHPPHWYEIGQRFDKLKDELTQGSKKSRNEIIAQLCEEFNRGAHSIDDALAYYNAALREHDRVNRED